MKRLTLLAAAFFCAGFLLFNCVGCPASASASGSGQSGQSSDGEKKEEEKEQTGGEDSADEGAVRKILIAYFTMPETDGVDTVAGASRVVKNGEVLGNVQFIAQTIQKATGGDLFRIETVQPYPGVHDRLVDQAKTEQNENARPRLARAANVAAYDVIFIGYPNWWGDLPMPLYTFLENTDLSGKTIVPFNVHGGSGFSNTISTIVRLQPRANVITDGWTVSRNTVGNAENDVRDWVKSLNFGLSSEEDKKDEEEEQNENDSGEEAPADEGTGGNTEDGQEEEGKQNENDSGEEAPADEGAGGNTEDGQEEEGEQNEDDSGEDAPADEGAGGNTEDGQEEEEKVESVVLSQTVTSQILGGARPYTIYLPPSYNVDTSREYPVLYLLHGLGQNHTSWATDGNMKAIADQAIANGTCEEMIIVSPEAYASFYVNGYYQGMNYEDFFFNDFIPAIESAYRIKANKGGRSISGLSMGGYGCTYHAFKRPEMFSSCFAMSAAFTGNYTQVGTLVTGKTAAELAAFPAFVMECGTENGGAYPMNNNLNSILAQTSLVYTYTTRPGRHDWAFWRECLPKALKLASDNFEL